MKKLTLFTTLILITALTSFAQVQYMEPFWIATGTTDTTELGGSIAGIGDIYAQIYRAGRTSAGLHFGSSVQFVKTDGDGAQADRGNDRRARAGSRP